MVFPHSILLHYRGSRLSSLDGGAPSQPCLPRGSESCRSLPFSPQSGLKGFAPCSMFLFFYYSPVLTRGGYSLDYSLSLLMVFPHPILLSQYSVEDFTIARSRHLFVLNEYNVFRHFETGYLAFAKSTDFIWQWPSALHGGQ